MNKLINIYALCQCDYYDFGPLYDHLTQSHEVQKFRNIIYLEWLQGKAFIFDYGVIVLWNISEAERPALLKILNKYAVKPVSTVIHDQFTYESNASRVSLKDDHISLLDDNIQTRLAVSHGIAQSTKLSKYEERVQNTINSTQYIPENIANKGVSGLKRKELAKLRGFLYLTKSDVMLHYDLLDVPEFFWENPELQSYYTMIAEYLEIRPRIEVINKKLETIQDLLQMIADEQKHTHSSLLEWIIIWLIAFDILILLVQEYLH